MALIHRNSFEIGLTIIRYMSERTFPSGREIQAQAQIRKLGILLKYIIPVSAEAYVIELEKITSDWSDEKFTQVWITSYLVAEEISTNYSDEVGTICTVGVCMALLNSMLNGASSQQPILVASARLKDSLEDQGSVISKAYGSRIISICDQATVVLPQSPEAKLLASQIGYFFSQEIPKFLEAITESKAPDVFTVKKRRLRILQEQSARYGTACPPHIIIEIEDLQREIEHDERTLESNS